MAVALPSSANTAWGSGTTLIITKPASLAVGDLMVAQVCSNGTDAITPPSGWTLIRTDTNGTIRSALYYIIATSTQVAASDFTWTFAGTVQKSGGILRITGHSSGVPIWTNNGDNTIVNTATPSFGNTITPAVADSMIVMFVVSIQNNNNNDTYAIVTSNPSWTEVWDNAVDDADDESMAAAYALRPEVTATGNASSGGGDATADWVGQLIAIPPEKAVTVGESITLTEVIKEDLTMIIAEIVTLTEAFTSATARVWANIAKSVSTWLNQDKSS